MEEMRWISVKEQLPKDSNPILISNGKYITYGCYCLDGTWKYGINDEPIFFIDAPPVHWLHFPIPPPEE